MQLELQLWNGNCFHVQYGIISCHLSRICPPFSPARHGSSSDIWFPSKYAKSAAKGCGQVGGHVEHFLKCTMRNNGCCGIACLWLSLGIHMPCTGCCPSWALSKRGFLSLAQAALPHYFALLCFFVVAFFRFAFCGLVGVGCASKTVTLWQDQ